MRGGRVDSSLNWFAIRSSTERRCRSLRCEHLSLVVGTVLDDERRDPRHHRVQYFGIRCSSLRFLRVMAIPCIGVGIRAARMWMWSSSCEPWGTQSN